ncbi:MAG: NB-ARC domain-containing protein [Anaerolineae bacterium]|nr:NB-ARC domain-containing protein [Anaerolineae bacterium]MCO5194245.1 NB-ARC domain-containing protein [Anaerolineae bacterium]
MTLLGGLGVTQNGSAVPGFGTRKAMALFCYLVIGRKSYSRSALAGLLWGDMPEANARMNLRRTLSRLRPINSHLHITPNEIGFNHDKPYYLDVEAFEAATNASKRSDTADTAPLRQAITLYKGEFLDGFYVRNAPAFEEWTLGQRARLRDLAVQTLHKLVVDCGQTGDLAAGIDYAKQLLAHDPWREEAHRQLMELLARSGRRNAALLQYETCRRVLSDELGVEPTPITRDLHERILHNRFDAFLPPPVEAVDEVRVRDVSAESPPRNAAPPKHNLQLPLTPLLGREKELDLLDQLLADPYARAITILGPGGIGKTRMALGIAENQIQADSFADGVFFVGLARLNSADEILAAIADALNFSFHRTADQHGQLLDYLRNKNLLLILDNFEHVMAGVTLVEDILRASPNSQVIITSREKLNRQWEYLFPLGGLSYPELNRYEAFSAESLHMQYDAVQLFLTCARRARPSFDVTASLEPILRICNLIEGMPLGIILSATWLEVLRPDEVVEEIQRGLDFLESELGDIPSRQRSLRATFAYSWRLLSDRERHIFQQLSVFQGGFTRVAAHEVTGATLHDLRSLVGKSLLTTELDGRYQIHELLRQFSAERLAQDEVEQQEARNRHATYFSELIEQLYTRVKGPEHKQIMALFDAENANARLAWHWAVENENSHWIGQMVEPLSLYYQWRGLANTFIDDLKQAEAVFAPCVASVPDKLMLIKLRTHIAARTTDSEYKKQLLMENIEWLKDSVFADIDTSVIESDCWFYFGGLYGPFDTVEQNLATRERSVHLSELAGDEWRLALTLSLLSTDYCWLAEFEKAAECARRSRPIAEKLGDPFLQKAQMAYEANVLNFITPAAEMAFVEKICRRYTELNYDLGSLFSPAPQQLIFSLCTQGKYDEARAEMLKGIATIEASNQPRPTDRSLYAISSVHFDDGSLTHSLLDVEAPDSGMVAGWFEAARGRLALANENRIQACKHFEQSLTFLREDNDPSDEIWIAVDSALATRNRKKLHNAIDGVLSKKTYTFVQWLLPAAALTVLEAGDVERAVEIYALAETYPAIAKSLWYQKVAREEIAASAEKLPAHVVAAAQERGRKLDTLQTLDQLRSELASTL